jgi:hypothetical protein
MKVNLCTLCTPLGLANNLSRYRIIKPLLQLLHCLLQPRLDADACRRLECRRKQLCQKGLVISTKTILIKAEIIP